jgi:hypothetical protein
MMTRRCLVHRFFSAGSVGGMLSDAIEGSITRGLRVSESEPGTILRGRPRGRGSVGSKRGSTYLRGRPIFLGGDGSLGGRLVLVVYLLEILLEPERKLEKEASSAVETHAVEGSKSGSGAISAALSSIS